MKNQEKSAVEALVEGWEFCVSNREAGVYGRARLNYETRRCLWANQSVDGKKWQAPKGKEIFPWPGASDARVPLVDKYIREDVAFLMTVRRRMRTTVSGVGTEDAGFGNRMTQLLRWQQNTQMRKEWGRENRLFASYGLEGGAALMKIWWAKERVLEYQEIDIETIRAAAMQEGLAVQATGGQGAEEGGELNAMDAMGRQGGMGAMAPQQGPAGLLLSLLLVEETEAEAGDVLLQLLDGSGELGLTKRKARRLARELRTEGHGKIAVPVVVKDRPQVKALRLNEDVFLAPEATGVGEEVYERELVTEGQLRERVGTLGWDEEFVEAVIETQRGVMSFAGNGFAGRSGSSGNGSVVYVGNGAGGLTSRLFEIIHAYRKVWDEDGVPEIRYTCFSPGLIRKDRKGSFTTEARRHGGDGSEFAKGTVGYDGPLGYSGGDLNFVLWERDKRSELVDDAPGYGEMAATMQRQIKVEWDARVDRNSMATLPPMFHRPGQEPERWGPGARMPLMRRDDVGFVEAPKYDPGSKEEEETVRKFADEYFGRSVDEQNMVEGQTLKQEMADTWMEACGQIDEWILKLDQQFLPEQIIIRVVGSQKGQSLSMTKDEIQGSFDLSVGYSTENMDQQVKAAKIGLLERVMAMDVNGIVDRDAAMAEAFELVDPSMGERILKPVEAAKQAELEDEDLVMSKMAAGIPVDIKPGQAYQLRLGRLKQLLTQSPMVQRKYGLDQNFKSLVDWRAQQLGHQVEQRENAQIGRLGGKAGFEQFPAEENGAMGAAMEGMGGMQGMGAPGGAGGGGGF